MTNSVPDNEKTYNCPLCGQPVASERIEVFGWLVWGWCDCKDVYGHARGDADYDAERPGVRVVGHLPREDAR